MQTSNRLGRYGMAAVAVIGMSWLGAGRLTRLDQDAGSGAVAQAEGMVLVHVAGAVKKPGMVQVPRRSRVMDAIKAAGGALEEADLNALNLAESVIDGMKIVVPGPGVAAPMALLSTPRGGSPSRPKKASLPMPNSVSLNSANASELIALPGVGPAIADRIIEYRRQNGGFRSIEELDAVKGIGPKKLQQIRPYVRL
jgi:competence protein ComEA